MMFASAWRMRSFVVAAVSLLLVQMVMDVYCSPVQTVATTTETRERSPAVNFTGNGAIKSLLSLAAVSAFYLFMTSNTANGEVSNTAQRTNDVMARYDIPVEASNYLNKTANNAIDDIPAGMMINGDSFNDVEFQAPEEGESATWLNKARNKLANETTQDSGTIVKRSAKEEKRGSKHDKKCEKNKNKFLTNYQDEVVASVQSDNPVVTLTDGQSQRAQEILADMENEGCDDIPASYELIRRRGYEYSPYKIILNSVNSLMSWANSVNPLGNGPEYSQDADAETPPSVQERTCEKRKKKITGYVKTEARQALISRSTTLHVDKEKVRKIRNSISAMKRKNCTALFDEPNMDGGDSDEFTLEVRDIEFLNSWARKRKMPEIDIETDN